MQAAGILGLDWTTPTHSHPHYFPSGTFCMLELPGMMEIPQAQTGDGNLTDKYIPTATRTHLGIPVAQGDVRWICLMAEEGV